MISQAAAFPHHVLISSTISRNFWTVIGRCRLIPGKNEMTKHHPVAVPNGALPVQYADMPSGLLRGPFWPEVVIERHLAVDDGVLFPLRRPPGKRDLRFDDFLEQRIVRRFFLDDLVVDLELRLENGVRRLVELHLVLGLQLDVVLRITEI